MASRTRLRVSARTSGSLLMTLDTVLDETCARSATSWMVTDAGMGVMESGQTSLRRLGAWLSYRVCRRRTRRARLRRLQVKDLRAVQAAVESIARANAPSTPAR